MSVLLAFDQLADPVPDSDIASLCDRATHVSVQAHGDPRHDAPRTFSTLTNIVFNGSYYGDKAAACDCASLELFKFGDEGYTRCAAHGVLSIGTLRREIVNGRRHG